MFNIKNQQIITNKIWLVHVTRTVKLGLINDLTYFQTNLSEIIDNLKGNKYWFAIKLKND